MRIGSYERINVQEIERGIRCKQIEFPGLTIPAEDFTALRRELDATKMLCSSDFLIFFSPNNLQFNQTCNDHEETEEERRIQDLNPPLKRTAFRKIRERERRCKELFSPLVHTMANLA